MIALPCYNFFMSKIRRLYYFDKKNTKEMISFLNNDSADSYVHHVMFNPLIPFHHILPLKLKFLPESYLLKEGRTVKGLITVAPTRCPAKQMEILKLLFEENCYEDAGELIQYVVSKYKAMGTASFIVRVDDNLPELVRLFVTRCGFSQISYEKLWKINNVGEDFDNKNFREFRDSDSYAVSNLYNDSLLPHIRPLLCKEPKEFKDSIFKGLKCYSEYKYIMKNGKSGNITAYISIKTSDNENYVIDYVSSSWAEIDVDEIINFAKHIIKKRKKESNLFIRTRRYTHLGEQHEQNFMQRKFDCVQNQIVLTNSSARIIKEPDKERKFIVLNRLYGGVGINTGVNT